MSETDRRIRELVGELQPVRPLPRLRAVLAALLASWAGVTALSFAVGAASPAQPGSLWRSPTFLAVFTGLATMALGALVAALASAVPGRGRAARIGRQTAWAGGVLALGAGAFALATACDPSAPLLWSLGCAGRACALGIAPALVACAFLLRASGESSLLGAGVAAAGAAALGGVAVHASCSAGDPVHWLLGHSLLPVAVAVLLVLPVAAWVGGRSRRP